jgi:hypothetical protein
VEASASGQGWHEATFARRPYMGLRLYHVIANVKSSQGGMVQRTRERQVMTALNTRGMMHAAFMALTGE